MSTQGMRGDEAFKGSEFLFRVLKSRGLSIVDFMKEKENWRNSSGRMRFKVLK